jgi:NAD(P)H-dependent FMN reductase
MMKWLLISGSFRKSSFNTQLSIIVRDIFENRLQVSSLDFTQVPLFNQDEEFPTPPAVEKVRQAVEEADGIWFFCPEYNGQVPGVLKNLLDWLSRPVKQGAPRTDTAVYQKAATVSGAGGQAAAENARAQLNTLLKTMGMNVMTEPELGIALSAEEWKTNYIILTEDQLTTIKNQGMDFMKFTQENMEKIKK